MEGRMTRDEGEAIAVASRVESNIYDQLQKKKRAFLDESLPGKVCRKKG